MQVQPYSRGDNLSPAVPSNRLPGDGYGSHSNGNGHLPQGTPFNSYPPAAPSNSNGPTTAQVMWQLIRARRKMLGVWLIITGLIAGLLVYSFGKPTWKAEGYLLYTPQFAYTSGKRLFTPPDIQTVLALVKSPQVVEKLREEQHLSMPAEAIQSKLTISIHRQTAMLAVEFDWPDPKQGAMLANRLMELAIDQYNVLRNKLVKETLEGLARDTRAADAKLSKAQQELSKLLRANGIRSTDLTNEIAVLRRSRDDHEEKLRRAETELLTAKNKVIDLERRIKITITNAKNPDTDDPLAQAENQLSELVAKSEQIRQTLLDKREVDKAKVRLPAAEEELIRIQGLLTRGFATRAEYDEAKAKRDEYRSVVEQAAREAELTQQQKDLQKKIMGMRRGGAGSSAVQALLLRKADAEQLCDSLPAEILTHKTRIEELNERMDQLQLLHPELDPLENIISSQRVIYNEYRKQQDEHAVLEQPHTADLRIEKDAETGLLPSSNNSMKIAVGTFGLSVGLFLGYIFLVAMPRHTSTGEVTARRFGFPLLAHHLTPPQTTVSPPAPREPLPPLPRPALPTPTKQEAQMEALAAQITQNVQERGAIVLFTPTNPTMPVEAIVGDLACHFAQLGDRVLIFDARPGNPAPPAWAGPSAQNVQDRVARYLEGAVDRPAACFTSTLMASIDYSRADLVHYLHGVIATYRFRRLVDDMRERYSLVLMIAPDMQSTHAEDNLSGMVEGVVLVLNEDTNPSEVEGYVHNLRSADSPVYGAVVVGN